MKNGPIEVIQSKGIKVQIYSSPAFGKESYIIAFYAGGQRKRERAKTLEAARAAAKAKIVELATGAAQVASFTPRQTAVVVDAIEVLKGIGVPLSQVVREYSEAHKILAGNGSIIDSAIAYAKDAERRKLPRKTVSQVVEEYLQYVETTGLSWQHRLDCKVRMGSAAKAFKTDIKDVSKEDIEAFLKAKGKRSPRSYNNDRSALVTLWNYAKRQKYLPKGEETAAELVPSHKDVGGEIQILTPENFSLLLANAPETFLPLVAIGGLAGLRTAEISRLHWNEIDFAQSHILVSAKKSKTAQRRLVPLCEALRAWLLPLARSEGRVMPHTGEASMMSAWGRAKKGIGIAVPVNALRHSYASYRLAQIQDVAQVALEMGNSPQKIFQNYRALVTATQAEKWFNIMPASDAKVAQFAA
jgi:integrase